ncbi:hypothetical protein E2C01_014978 [Portunus trituberculatus]|uniref:Secreted protein n=1 Tax=Portunus trituberculatus TaxID=210409 RepID=A0A5B7DLK8_PORTR|nr:hypothetical protein [Portunus trituberculatus]
MIRLVTVCLCGAVASVPGYKPVSLSLNLGWGSWCTAHTVVLPSFGLVDKWVPGEIWESMQSFCPFRTKFRVYSNALLGPQHCYNQ